MPTALLFIEGIKMIKEFDGRLLYGQKVRAYRNLNNGLVSVQNYTKGIGWRLFGHTDTLALQSVKYVVSEPARLKMVAAQRRAVHAYAEGILLEEMPLVRSVGRLAYNPYRSGSFTIKETDNIILNSDYLIVANNIVFVSLN